VIGRKNSLQIGVGTTNHISWFNNWK
jgi:hypothetical protein